MRNDYKDREILAKSEVSIDQIIKQADVIASKRRDYRVKNPSRRCYFTKEGLLQFESDEGHFGSVEMSDWAMGQFCSKIGVPGNYIQKLITDGYYDLAQNNVNTYLKEQYGGGFKLREYDGKLDAVVSPRYSPFDSDRILDIITSTIDIEHYKLKGSYISDERLHLRLIGRDTIPINGEDLFPGIFIDSSDVGRNILIVSFGIYKQVCTNGLIISKAGGILFKQKHIGISEEEFILGLSNGLSGVDELVSSAENWINNARIKEMSLEDISTKLKAISLADEEEKILELMDTHYDRTRWGLINGITEIAQNYTLDRRVELETVAGTLLVPSKAA